MTGSRIQNVTSAYNISDPEMGYETFTKYLLRSKNSFIEDRYGGLTFGHEKTEVDPEVDEVNEESNNSLPFLATHSAAKVWYSLKGYHAMPTYLNVMNNAILRANLDKDRDPSKFGVCVCVCAEKERVMYMCIDICVFHTSFVFIVHLHSGIHTVSHPFKISELHKAFYAVT